MRSGLLAALVVAFALPAAAQAPRCADHVPGERPQNTAREFVGDDLDRITERGWIEFAAYEAYPPWSWEEGGRAHGVDVEIGRLIADSLGVEARFRFVAAGETLEADLRNWVWKGPVVGGRVANVMLHVPYDSDFACRVEQVVFTGQAYAEEIAIAYREDAYPDDPPLPAYFRFDAVAVENDTIADFYLSGLAGGQLSAQIRRFPSMRAAMEALNAGETKAAMGPRAELEHFAGPGVKVHQPPLPGFARGRWTLGLAVHHSHRPLAYAADYAIEEALADGRIAAIFAEYGLTWSAPER